MMKWKGFGTKRSWPNFKVLSQPGELRKTAKTFDQDSRSPGPRF
jgi:hypothetical protein